MRGSILTEKDGARDLENAFAHPHPLSSQIPTQTIIRIQIDSNKKWKR